MSQGNTPDWLRVREAARQLGVSTSTLRRWADSGKVPSMRTLGGQRRFAPRDLERVAAGTARKQPGRRLQTSASGHLAQLVEASLDFGRSLTFDRVLVSIARRLRAAAAADVCDIYAWEAAGPRGLVSIADGQIDKEFAGRTFPVDVYYLRAPGERRPQHVEIEDVEADKAMSVAERQLWRQWGFRSGLLLPLVADGQKIGEAGLYRRAPGRFDCLDLLMSLGQLAAQAMSNATLHRDLDQHARRAALISEASLAFTSSLDPHEVLVSSAERLCRVIDVPCCDIYSLGQDGITCEASITDGQIDERWLGHHVPLDEWDSSRLALDTRSTIVIENVRDERLSDTEREAMAAWHQQSVLSVPLVVKDRAVGLVELAETRYERRFTADEIAAVESVCRVAALAFENAELYRAQEQQNARLRSLLNASKALSSSLVLEEVLDAVAKQASESLGAGECTIYAYDAEHDTLQTLSFYEVQSSGQVISDTPTPLSDYPMGREVLESGQVLMELISDPDLDPGSRASMEKWGEKSCLMVPLRFGDERLGLLVITEADEERRYGPEELDLARSLSELAATAIHNAREHRAVEEQSRRLASLLDVSRTVTSTLRIDHALSMVAKAAMDTLGSSACMIGEYVAGDDTVTCRAVCSRGGRTNELTGRQLPLDDHPACRRQLTTHEILYESLSDPALNPKSRANLERQGGKCSLSVPLVFAGEALGVMMIIENDEERTYDATEIEFARGLSELAAVAIHNGRLFAHLEERTTETSLLNRMARIGSSSLKVEEIAERTIEGLKPTLPISGGSLIVVRDGVLDVVYSSSGASARLKDVAVAALDPAFVQRLGNQKVLSLELPSEVPLADPSLADGFASAAVVALMSDEATTGALILGSPLPHAFTESDRRLLQGVGAHLSLSINNARLYEGTRRMHKGSLEALSLALTAKDYYTLGHTARVAGYAVLLAQELGWPSETIDQVEEVAYLHDLGKIAVSDRVLLKAGPLSDEEWQLMWQHPTISAEITAPLLEGHLVAGISSHHERYDGKGYPAGLAGEEIPLMARLLSVCDAYDAMSSQRVYRRSLCYTDCLQELRRCAGTQFDPAMVEAFLRVLDRLASQRRYVAAAAQAAAARTDPGLVADAQGDGDAAAEARARIKSILQAARTTHPALQTLVVKVRLDEMRGTIIVDAGPEASFDSREGEIAFFDDVEMQILAGSEPDTNALHVDSRGTWVLGAAPVIDAGTGARVALVCAAVAPILGAPAGGLEGTISQTFAQITRSAARQTRTEVENLTDALTGLYNHRYFHERLEGEVQAARERQDALSVLLCDVDGFSRINDAHGHAVGDEVLRTLAQTVSSSIRRVDVAARYAGDQIAVLLAGVAAAEAADVAERVRADVASAAAALRVGNVAISVGVASLPAHASTRRDLLEAARAAVDTAKQRGGNEVVVFAAPAGKEARGLRSQHPKDSTQPLASR